MNTANGKLHSDRSALPKRSLWSAKDQRRRVRFESQFLSRWQGSEQVRRVAWNLDSGTFSKWGASSSLWAIYMWRKLHESIEKRSHKVCYCGKLRRSAKVFSGWLRRAVLHVILCYPGLAILSAIESSEISTPSLQIRNHTNSCCLQILLSDILGTSVSVLVF